MAELSDQEMLRYNRQIILRGFDFDGQEALKDSRVLIVGLGGLGGAASQYLASAGGGNLTLLGDATVGQPKVESARDALTRINPHIAITPVNALLDDAELAALIAEHDLVLDCTDNVAVRNQLNAGCFAAKVPLVSGAAIRMEGQITVFTYQEGEPCYRCISLIRRGTPPRHQQIMRMQNVRLNRRSAKRSLPVLLKLRHSGINRRIANHLLCHIQWQSN